MPRVFECEIALTSRQLLSDPRLDTWVGHTLELWLFEGVQARQALAIQLQQRGIHAQVYSAYKPLLHAFLEEIDTSTLASVVIEYPRHTAADPRRFLLEGYPLEAVIPGIEVSWVAAQDTAATSTSTSISTEQPVYRLALTDRSGLVRTVQLVAPNALKTDLALGQQSLCPTGYLRVSDSQSGQLLLAERLETEFEQAFLTLMRWVSDQSWGSSEPYFERLLLRVELPGAEIVDQQGRLLVSTYEALHEDLYFSVLEFFQHRSTRPSGNRGLQPGQIVPDIRFWRGLVKVYVECYPVGSPLFKLQQPEHQSALNDSGACTQESVHTSKQEIKQEIKQEVKQVIKQEVKQVIKQEVKQVISQEVKQVISQASAHEINLQTCREPLSSESIRAGLALFSGQPFEVLSRQGRAVTGVHRRGTLPAIVLTGGQHANEASGVVGALRGAQWLAAQPEAHFAVVPLENPDGYALFAQYRAIHPQHMHHAARYTGLGDDLEYREQGPWYETEARQQAIALTQAQLHLSLHGYPAHEWTRPLTGYLPRGFALWSLPKGFFLIVRYQAAYKDLALQWLEALAESVSRLPGVAQFNRAQLQRYESYLGVSGFELKHGIACMLSQNDQQNVGVKLVTEFPDETIAGEEFMFAQQVQTDTVRLACLHWWRLHSAA